MRGEAWSQDVKDLDNALSRARHPAGLLPHRLAEIEKLAVLEQKGKQGHLPNCMCQTCRAAAFQRAVGVEKSSDAASTSLNASSLLAYQELMNAQNDEPPPSREEEVDQFQGPPPKSYKHPEELIPEIRALGARYNLDGALISRLMQLLKTRGDNWYQDLLDLTMGIQRSRNPNGLVGFKLAHVEKYGEIPKPPCFHFRQGICKYGNRCQKSHDPAAQAELPLPSEFGQTPCYDFQHGICKHGRNCRFQHDPALAPTPPPPRPQQHKMPAVMDRVSEKHTRQIIVHSSGPRSRSRERSRSRRR